LKTAKPGRKQRFYVERNDPDTVGMKRNELKLPPLRRNAFQIAAGSRNSIEIAAGSDRRFGKSQMKRTRRDLSESALGTSFGRL